MYVYLRTFLILVTTSTTHFVLPHTKKIEHIAPVILMSRSKLAIAVNHISDNLVESEISGVRTTVSAFIFYDIRKR